MLKIPHQAFFYWGGSVLPYLRYMSLYSFRKFNPDWKIILYIPKGIPNKKDWCAVGDRNELNTEDYMDRLESLGIHVVSFDMESIGFSNGLPEVQKSDVLRLYLLSTTGGLWSDLDIIYFRPVDAVLQKTDHTAYFCYRCGAPTELPYPANSPYLYHSIGFLLGAPGNKHYSKLFEVAKSIISIDGGYIGSPFYQRTVQMGSPDIYNLDIKVVYPTRLASLLFTKPAERLKRDVIQDGVMGLHWYGGATESLKAQIYLTEKTYRNYDNIVCYLVRCVNDGKTA